MKGDVVRGLKQLFAFILWPMLVEACSAFALHMFLSKIALCQLSANRCDDYWAYIYTCDLNLTC